MFPSSCQQLPTTQWSPIPSAIFFRIFGGCSMLMVRNAATGGPTSPTVSKGLRTVSALPISPRNCRSYRRRTRIGSWDAPLSRDSTGPRSNATARRTRSLRWGFASIADFLDGYKFDREHASWANQPPLRSSLRSAVAWDTFSGYRAPDTRSAETHHEYNRATVYRGLLGLARL